MKDMINQLNQLGVENNLTFSSQNIFNGSVIGLDGVNRKMVILQKQGEDLTFIDLADIRSCSVKKNYRPIQAGELKTKKLHQYLQSIVLHFELYDKPALEIVFYKYPDNNILDIPALEKKAKQWEGMLSKIINIKKTNYETTDSNQI